MRAPLKTALASWTPSINIIIIIIIIIIINCLKRARKLFKKEKSCTKSEKLLEGLKVAPNLKSCSKVAEQLMDSPKGGPGLIPRVVVIYGLSLFHADVSPAKGFKACPPHSPHDFAAPLPKKLCSR